MSDTADANGTLRRRVTLICAGYFDRSTQGCMTVLRREESQSKGANPVRGAYRSHSLCAHLPVHACRRPPVQLVNVTRGSCGRARGGCCSGTSIVKQGRPDESGELPGARDHRLRRFLSAPQQVLLSSVQPLLRLDGNGDDCRRLSVSPPLERGPDPWRMSVVPARLDQHAPRVAVARLGDPAAPGPIRARVLARHQA